MTPTLAAWIALVAYSVGVGLTFGVRSWVQWRKTGFTGFRGVSGRPGSLPWWGGVLFVVSLILAGLAPVLVLTGATTPAFAHPALGWIGLLVALGGAGLTVASQHAMGDTWRVGVDETETTRLVQDGVFAVVRNPVFSSMMLALGGMTLLVPTSPALAALACLSAAAHIQVRVVEEPHLSRMHGATYRAYRDRTGRFFPRIRTVLRADR